MVVFVRESAEKHQPAGALESPIDLAREQFGAAGWRLHDQVRSLGLFVRSLDRSTLARERWTPQLGVALSAAATSSEAVGQRHSRASLACPLRARFPHWARGVASAARSA